jgi:S-adenosylmethionine:diacylglycerol 3-amino-3-carboxypropyl transferase
LMESILPCYKEIKSVETQSRFLSKIGINEQIFRINFFFLNYDNYKIDALISSINQEINVNLVLLNSFV